MQNPDYYIDIAERVARASKDGRTKVGCVIVGPDGEPVSWGYNGMGKGLHEEALWGIKQQTVIHAEMNALLFANKYLGGCTMYVTHEPCENCLKHALQKGVRTFYFRHPYGGFTDVQKKAIYLLQTASGAHIERVS